MTAKATPKKRTRNLEQTRKTILDVAFFEVFSRSFQGVSIDDIVARTKLTKGAFYHHFPTKLDLGYALVEEVITPMILDRWIFPLEAFENPLEGILEQLHNLIGKAQPEELRLGCPLNNLVQEMAPVDAGFRTRLEASLTSWIDEMDRHLKRGQKNGYLREDVNTRQVAHFVVMSHEGFYGMLKGLNDPRAFAALSSSLQMYFTTIEAKPTKRRTA
ncbi:MAG: TetR/AcrR family transcriptional regulator [Bdellovibrionaceae bacterium]|nr:TetR/AcrR family transcriptional regulator [Pseudobdellovibrionaceae bacterium]